MKNLLAAVVLCILPAQSFAQDIFIATIDTKHQIAKNWFSESDVSGYAEFTIDRENKTISGNALVSNITKEQLADAGQMGPSHFHNFPQGGDFFFVQHFPWSYEQRGNDLYMWFEDWVMEDPMVGSTAEFVLDEVYRGNGYFAIHTREVKWRFKENSELEECAAPLTAAAGDLIKVN